MRVIDKIVLSPPEDSVDLLPIDQGATIRALEKIVKAGGYTKMGEIDSESFSVAHPSATQKTYNVLFQKEQRGLKEIAFLFPDVILPDYCCEGNGEKSSPCKATVNAFRLWVSMSNKISLLEYSVIQDPKGCDWGPAFKAARGFKDFKF